MWPYLARLQVVHVTLDVEWPIQHSKSTPVITVHSIPNHYTPAVPLVLFFNAGVGIVIAYAVPHHHLLITMGETKLCLIDKSHVPNYWHVNQGCLSSSGALQHAAAYSGWGLDTGVGQAMLITWDDNAWSVWIFVCYGVTVFLHHFLWMVSTNPIGVWGEYANLLTVCFSWR